jgi:hypothetical protein
MDQGFVLFVVIYVAGGSLLSIVTTQGDDRLNRYRFGDGVLANQEPDRRGIWAGKLKLFHLNRKEIIR